MTPEQKRAMVAQILMGEGGAIPMAMPPQSPYQAATRDNMMEGAGMDPSMRAQAGPDLPVMNRGKWMFDDPTYEAMWRDLSPEEQAIVMQRIESGEVGSLDEAFAPQGFTTRR